MEYAVNATTFEKISAVSIGLDNNPSYQFPEKENWYADVNSIASFDKEKVSDVTKIIVKYRDGSENVMNRWGTSYNIAPHFYIPNKEELGINTIPESPEHKMVKTWIYNRIKNKDLHFNFSTITRPFEYENKMNLADLDIDYNKIGMEIIVKEGFRGRKQIADIIVPFKKQHILLGFGIVIEIQFSPQDSEVTEDRSVGWAMKGYSIAWVFKDSIKHLSADYIELTKNEVIINIPDRILSKYQLKIQEQIKLSVQNLSRAVDEKMKQLNYPSYLGVCPRCKVGYMVKKKGQGGKPDWYGCSAWRDGCKHSFSIAE